MLLSGRLPEGQRAGGGSAVKGVRPATAHPPRRRCVRGPALGGPVRRRRSVSSCAISLCGAVPDPSHRIPSASFLASSPCSGEGAARQPSRRVGRIGGFGPKPHRTAVLLCPNGQWRDDQAPLTAISLQLYTCTCIGCMLLLSYAGCHDTHTNTLPAGQPAANKHQ